MRRLVRLAVVLVTLTSPGGGARSEAPPASPEPAPTPAPAAEAPNEPAGPQPIPIAKIARAEAEARERLDAIEAGLSPAVGELEIIADLPRREAEIGELTASLASERQQIPSPRVVEENRGRWERIGVVLKGWQTRLEGVGEEVQARQAEVRSIGEVWEATHEDATIAGAPAVVTQRIAAVGARTEQLQGRIKDRMDSLLVLQDRVLHLREAVDAGRLKVSQQVRALQESLFALESKPLWKAMASPQRAGEVLVEMRETTSATASEYFRWVRSNPLGPLAHIAAFVALAAGLAALRRSSREWLASSDPHAADASVILSRPVDSAALLVLVATIWTARAAPDSVRHVCGLLVLIPFFRMLPLIARNRFVPPLGWLGIIWLIERLRSVVLPHTLLERLMLLATGIIGLVWLRKTLRSEMLTQPGPRERLRRAAFWACWPAAISLVVAVVSNVLGNVTLAELLTDGAVGAAFAAVVFYAVVSIVNAVIVVVLRSPAIQGLEPLRRRADELQARWGRAVAAAALLGWAYVTLRMFQLWDPAVRIATEVLAKRWTAGKIDISLGDIAASALALAVAVAVSKFSRLILDDWVLPPLGLPRGVPNTISTTVQYVIVAIGVVAAFLAAGIDLGRVGFLAGALGVGIGFGLQNVVNNFISGVILIYERPINEGDVIEVGTVKGSVRRIGIRSSTVRTFDGADVVVPNATLLSAEVINWTLHDTACRAELKIGVAYGTDPRRVIEILARAAAARKDVLSRPKPFVLFTGLGESSLDFLLRFWTADYDSLLAVKSALLADVYAALGEAGIEIPFPQRDIHVRTVAEGAPKPIAIEESTE